MSKRNLISAGLLAFGAGIAVGARWPRAGRLATGFLQKLGVEFSEAALLAWDPEAAEQGGREKAAKTSPSRGRVKAARRRARKGET